MQKEHVAQTDDHRNTAAEAAVAKIVHALGGDPRNGMCPCPVATHHQTGKSPPLHVEVGSKQAVVFKCFGGCSQEAVKAALAQRASAQAAADGAAGARARKRREAHHHRLALQIFHMANRPEWKEQRRPVIEAYFASRGGLPLPPNVGMLLASQVGQLASAEAKLGEDGVGFRRKGCDAIVVPVWDADERHEELIGVELTYLDAGHRNERDADGRSVRQLIGSGGGLVRAGLCDGCNSPATLVLTESLEDGCAVHAATGWQVLSCISASHMQKLKLPEQLEQALDVIIAAQNDVAGQKAGETLRAALLSQGHTVALRFSHNKDWNDDWNDPTLTDKDIFERLNVAGEQGQSRLLPLPPTMAEFAAVKRPPVEPLIAPFLYRRGSTTIHGPTGTMKTRLALTLAYTLATGGTFCGWQAARPVKVLFFDAELPAELLEWMSAQLGPVSDNLYVLSRDDFEQRYGVDLRLADDELAKAFLANVEELGVEVVVIDSRWAAFDVHNIESEAQQQARVDACLRALRGSGVATILIDHDNKTGGQSGYAVKTRFDSVNLHLTPLRPGPDADPDLSEVRLDFDKHRHLPRGQQKPWRLSMHVPDDAFVEWTAMQIDDAVSEDDHRRRGEQVRQMHYREHMPKQAIADRLNISMETVDYYLKMRRRPA